MQICEKLPSFCATESFCVIAPDAKKEARGKYPHMQGRKARKENAQVCGSGMGVEVEVGTNPAARLLPGARAGQQSPAQSNVKLNWM